MSLHWERSLNHWTTREVLVMTILIEERVSFDRAEISFIFSYSLSCMPKVSAVVGRMGEVASSAVLLLPWFSLCLSLTPPFTNSPPQSGSNYPNSFPMKETKKVQIF